MDTKTHWDRIYSTKTENEVSWFQRFPTTSVAFLESFHLAPTAKIIDIGGGDSHFVDVLLEKDYQNICVLDISASAIERAKKRLSKKAEKIQWIVSDVAEFDFNDLHFDLWHDRAAFHFLTTEDKIYRYISSAARAVVKNGYLVLGTFSEQGPKKCSGLDIRQYSESTMSSKFQPSLKRSNVST